MNVWEHYTYQVRWSAEDQAFVATVAELPSLSWLADDNFEALSGIQQLAAEVVADLRQEGQEPPIAFADREYSGKFQVRIPPETHRKLAIAAAEQHVSLNRLISTRLVGV